MISADHGEAGGLEEPAAFEQIPLALFASIYTRLDLDLWRSRLRCASRRLCRLVDAQLPELRLDAPRLIALAPRLARRFPAASTLRFRRVKDDAFVDLVNAVEALPRGAWPAVEHLRFDTDDATAPLLAALARACPCLLSTPHIFDNCSEASAAALAAEARASDAPGGPPKDSPAAPAATNDGANERTPALGGPLNAAVGGSAAVRSRGTAAAATCPAPDAAAAAVPVADPSKKGVRLEELRASVCVTRCLEALAPTAATLSDVCIETCTGCCCGSAPRALAASLARLTALRSLTWAADAAGESGGKQASAALAALRVALPRLAGRLTELTWASWEPASAVDAMLEAGPMPRLRRLLLSHGKTPRNVVRQQLLEHHPGQRVTLSAIAAVAPGLEYLSLGPSIHLAQDGDGQLLPGCLPALTQLRTHAVSSSLDYGCLSAAAPRLALWELPYAAQLVPLACLSACHPVPLALRALFGLRGVLSVGDHVFVGGEATGWDGWGDGLPEGDVEEPEIEEASWEDVHTANADRVMEALSDLPPVRTLLVSLAQDATWGEQALADTCAGAPRAAAAARLARWAAAGWTRLHSLTLDLGAGTPLPVGDALACLAPWLGPQLAALDLGTGSACLPDEMARALLSLPLWQALRSLRLRFEVAARPTGEGPSGSSSGRGAAAAVAAGAAALDRQMMLWSLSDEALEALAAPLPRLRPPPLQTLSLQLPCAALDAAAGGRLTWGCCEALMASNAGHLRIEFC